MIESLLLVPVAAAAIDRLQRWRGRSPWPHGTSAALTAVAVVAWTYWCLLALPESAGVAASVIGWGLLAAGSNAARTPSPRLEPPSIERCPTCQNVAPMRRAA